MLMAFRLGKIASVRGYLDTQRAYGICAASLSGAEVTLAKGAASLKRKTPRMPARESVGA